MATKKKTTKKATSETAAKKPATKKTPAAKKTSSTAPAVKQTESVKVAPEDYYKMVQEAAYFQAEADDFSKDPSFYWLAAEKEITKRLEGK